MNYTLTYRLGKPCHWVEGVRLGCVCVCVISMHGTTTLFAKRSPCFLLFFLLPTSTSSLRDQQAGAAGQASALPERPSPSSKERQVLEAPGCGEEGVWEE